MSRKQFHSSGLLVVLHVNIFNFNDNNNFKPYTYFNQEIHSPTKLIRQVTSRAIPIRTFNLFGNMVDDRQHVYE